MLRIARRISGSGRSFTREVIGGLRLVADHQSFVRYATDVFLYRILRIVNLPSSGQERSIRLHGGIEITYRLNRGDIQSIREVWIDESYRLPYGVVPKIVIDLGANIGLTSLWLARRYNCPTIIAVEPLPSNASLVRRNLANNGIVAEVIEAAVGPNDGSTFFDAQRDSNAGRVSMAGIPIRMISMDSILSMLREMSIVDLVKMDIEGGEQALLSSNLAWLDRIRSLIVEFHPPLVDYPGLVSTLERTGFRYIPAGSTHTGSMDGFVRESWNV